jgi:hypothetical protein
MNITKEKRKLNNLRILQNAIANGEKVSTTLDKLDNSIPMDSISFMVSNGRFVKRPIQLSLLDEVL